MNLIKAVDAETKDELIQISISESAKINVIKRLKDAGVNLHKDWLIFHSGVSETKREYPEGNWIEMGKLLRDRMSFQLIITGAPCKVY